MAITLVASVKKALKGTFTTDAIDTTGATILVMAICSYNGAPALSDSKTNDWGTPVVTQTRATETTSIYIVQNPNVGSGHTFTATGTYYTGMCVAAFSGVLTASAIEQSISAQASAASLQPGNLTPWEDNELLVTALGTDNANAKSINSSFTVAQDSPYLASNYMGCALAYKVQTTASPDNPTWSWTGSSNASALMVALRATDHGDDYEANFLTGGSASASNTFTTYTADKACDDNLDTYWETDDVPPTTIWWQYDSGAGVTKICRRLRMACHDVVGNNLRLPTEFTLKASNTGAFGGEETTLLTVSGITWSLNEWKKWDFANSTGYRYHRIGITAIGGAVYTLLTEVEMMEIEATAGAPLFIRAPEDPNVVEVP